uniref:Uncharacterized protein n=1 Tax=Meloidogyne hapla TaxID=6305 RepID=A0A1I8BUC5_MELHA
MSFCNSAFSFLLFVLIWNEFGHCMKGGFFNKNKGIFEDDKESQPSVMPSQGKSQSTGRQSQRKGLTGGFFKKNTSLFNEIEQGNSSTGKQSEGECQKKLTFEEYLQKATNSILNNGKM